MSTILWSPFYSFPTCIGDTHLKIYQITDDKNTNSFILKTTFSFKTYERLIRILFIFEEWNKIKSIQGRRDFLCLQTTFYKRKF